MTDAAASIPAGVLALSGIAILVGSRFGLSDRNLKRFCFAALAAAALLLALRGPGSQTAARVPSSAPNDDQDKSVSVRGRLIADDALGRTAAWMSLGFAFLLAMTGAGAGVGQSSARLGLILISASGVMLCGIADDFVAALFGMIVAALPVAVSLYAEANSKEERTAAAWWMVFTLAAIGVLIVGSVMIVRLSGTTSLAELPSRLAQTALSRIRRAPSARPSIWGECGCILIVAGLGVYFLAAPFQMAGGEIFDRAKTWSLGFAVLFPRAAAFLFLFRVLVAGMPRYAATVQTALTAVAILTTVIGSVLALMQTRIRRLLAFAVAIQGALVLGGLAGACSEVARNSPNPWLGNEIPGGVGSAGLCLAIDSLALVGLLGLLGSRVSLGREIQEIDELTDLFPDDRLLRGTLCVLLISLAGLPPFAGFWARAAVVRSTLSIAVRAENGFLPHQNVDYVVFAAAATLGMLALTAVCMRIVVRVLFREPNRGEEGSTDSRQSKITRGTSAWVAVAVAASLATFGLFPALPARLAARATSRHSGAAENAERRIENPTQPASKRLRAAIRFPEARSRFHL